MAIIDFPHEVMRVASISWTPETTHGALYSPFTGQATVQRGQLERWRFEAELRPNSAEEAQEIQAFFLLLEGQANIFRMWDPAQPQPKGHGHGAPLLNGEHLGGAREILTDGWLPSVINQLRPGDWLSIGEQLCKVSAAVHSNGDGWATIPIWPALWGDHPDDAPVIIHQATGLFRMLAELPSWQVSAANRVRPYSFRISGVGEVYLHDYSLPEP